jgi:hypothetical protein
MWVAIGAGLCVGHPTIEQLAFEYDLGKNRAVGQPNVAIRVLSRTRRTQTTLARHRGIAMESPLLGLETQKMWKIVRVRSYLLLGIRQAR